MLRFPDGNHKRSLFLRQTSIPTPSRLRKNQRPSYSSTVMWDKIVIVIIFIKGRVPACYRWLWVLVHSVSYRQQRASRFSMRAYARPSVSRKVTFLVLWIIHSQEIHTVHFWPSSVLMTALGICAWFWHGWVLQNTVSFSKMLFRFIHAGFHSDLAAKT